MDDDLCLDVKCAAEELSRIAPTLGLREERIHDRLRRIHLELIVARVLPRGTQEKLEHIILPQRAVMLAHIGLHVRVVQFREKINPLTIPQQPRGRARFRRRSALRPRLAEILHPHRTLPHRLVGASIKHQRRLGPATFERFGGGRGSGESEGER